MGSVPCTDLHPKSTSNHLVCTFLRWDFKRRSKAGQTSIVFILSSDLPQWAASDDQKDWRRSVATADREQGGRLRACWHQKTQNHWPTPSESSDWKIYNSRTCDGKSTRLSHTCRHHLPELLQSEWSDYNIEIVWACDGRSTRWVVHIGPFRTNLASIDWRD